MTNLGLSAFLSFCLRLMFVCGVSFYSSHIAIATQNLGEGVVWKAFQSYGNLPMKLQEDCLKLAGKELTIYRNCNSLFDKNEIKERGINLFSGNLYLVYQDEQMNEKWTDAIPIGGEEKHLFTISGNRDALLLRDLKGVSQNKAFLSGLLEESQLKKSFETLQSASFLPLENAAEKLRLSGIISEDCFFEQFKKWKKDLEDSLENLNIQSECLSKDQEFVQLKNDINTFSLNAFSQAFPVKVSNVHQGTLKRLQERENNKKKETIDKKWTHSDVLFLYRLTHELDAILQDDCDQYNNIDKFLPTYLKKEGNQNRMFTRALFVLHSTHDMCSRCTVTLARHYAAQDGFVQKLQSILEEHNQYRYLANAINNLFMLTSSDQSTDDNDIQVNLIVASRKGYDESQEKLEHRRSINHNEEEYNNIDLDDLWHKRCIVQWEIPENRLYALLNKKAKAPAKEPKLS